MPAAAVHEPVLQRSSAPAKSSSAAVPLAIAAAALLAVGAGAWAFRDQIPFLKQMTQQQIAQAPANTTTAPANVAHGHEVHVALRERKTAARVPPTDPVSLIIPAVQPLPNEPVVVKHRVNAFFGTDLEMILRAHDIDTLVLLGHATSGVIVSTVRYAADADYRLVVVEDGCADRDAEMHTFLMQRLFPRQATVVSAEAVIQALAMG